MKTASKTLLISVFTFLLGISLSLLTARPALAFEDIPDGYIPEGEIIHDDVFISSDKVVIDGIVNGDVLVSANSFVLNGQINGNLLLNVGSAEISGLVMGSTGFFGQQLVVNSVIDGTVYFAGAQLVITERAQVNRNILFGGYSLMAESGSIIGRDVHGSGQQAVFSGSVGRNIYLDLTALAVNGDVGGDVIANVSGPSSTLPDTTWFSFWANFSSADQQAPELESITPGIVVNSSADIGGKLHYSSPVEQSDTINIEPAEGIEYSPALPDADLTARSSLFAWVLVRLRELLTLTALGALAVWLLPSSLPALSQHVRSRPLPAFGWGIITILLGYTALIVLAIMIVLLGTLFAVITLGGLAAIVFGIGFAGLVFLAGLFTVLVLYGSKLILVFAIGGWLLNRFRPQGQHSSILILGLGLLVYTLLRLIPVVSPVIAVIAILFGLGAVLLDIKAKKKKMPPESPPMPE